MTGVATMPFPFLPRHLTVITALTIGIPGFFLALMPNTQRFRAGFLSRVLRFTIPAGVVAATTTFGSYYTALATAGGTETAGAIAAAQVSGAVTLFCVALTVLLLVARPWNPLRLAIVAASGVGFVLAMVIQLETGGNFTELLGVLSRLIRERFSLMGKIKVLATEGKLSAYIMTALPFVVAGVLQLVNPLYMKNLYQDPAGLQILIGALLMMSAGVLWMFRIIKIRI
jgi:hypothetical protein